VSAPRLMRFQIDGRVTGSASAADVRRVYRGGIRMSPGTTFPWLSTKSADRATPPGTL